MNDNARMDANGEPDAEVLTPMAALQAVYQILEPFEEEVRERVLISVATMLGISATGTKSRSSGIKEMLGDKNHVDENNENSSEYNSFAELYAKADPTLNSDKALVAGYWLQVCEGAENFSGFSINSELTNLGHRIANVTDALSSLIKMKPQLVLQLRKTGKSRQARKTYKLSKSGIDKVKEMIGG